jgi:hypothetical protein
MGYEDDPFGSGAYTFVYERIRKRIGLDDVACRGPCPDDFASAGQWAVLQETHALRRDGNGFGRLTGHRPAIKTTCLPEHR